MLFCTNSFFLTMYKFNDKYFTKKVSVYVVPVLRWLKYMFCMEVRDGVVG